MYTKPANTPFIFWQSTRRRCNVSRWTKIFIKKRFSNLIIIKSIYCLFEFIYINLFWGEHDLIKDLSPNKDSVVCHCLVISCSCVIYKSVLCKYRYQHSIGYCYFRSSQTHYEGLAVFFPVKTCYSYFLNYFPIIKTSFCIKSSLNGQNDCFHYVTNMAYANQ